MHEKFTNVIKQVQILKIPSKSLLSKNELCTSILKEANDTNQQCNMEKRKSQVTRKLFKSRSFKNINSNSVPFH